MVKILVPTKPDDAHAIYVKLAIKKKGHQCDLWYTADFPQQQTHSFELMDDEIHWTAQGTEFNIAGNEKYDVVWLRRPRKPRLPNTIHPDDIENAKNENTMFFKMLWQVIAPHAFWVNPISTAVASNCKLLQLKIAKEIGFSIPETLVSNDPEKIKRFIKIHNLGVIYKTLFPVMWINENEMRLTYTNEIEIDTLPSDSMLQNTPGIFQTKISKAFELRVTYFGDRAIAVKLKSQEHPRGRMDWRYVPGGELTIEEFILPKEIDSKCKLFMRRLGLVFGCFDFIVTPDDEYYFLEINEQGQFLWIEDNNPNIKMLDAFSDFLINCSRNFKWKQSKNSISVLDLQSSMITLQANAMKKHINPDLLF